MGCRFGGFSVLKCLIVEAGGGFRLLCGFELSFLFFDAACVWNCLFRFQRICSSFGKGEGWGVEKVRCVYHYSFHVRKRELQVGQISYIL